MENHFELNDFGYDTVIIKNEVKDENKQNLKKNIFTNILSNLFTKKNEIIKKKSFRYKSPKRISCHLFQKREPVLCGACPSESLCFSSSCLASPPMYLDIMDNENKVSKDAKEQINFDELILTQDIFEGNSDNNNETKLLIQEEKDIYEKIKKISEDKGIKEENGYITILVLYYIYTKKSLKVEELKFVIKKAKAFIKKIYGIEYEEISKDIENK